jgi:glutaryl-CoA dehydrogenase
MLTTAVKSNDSYIIQGKKTWTTNGSIADIIIVWAKTDAGMAAFIVEPTTRGFSANDITGKHGMRISVQSELTFDNCTIPASNKLPGATGLKSCLLLLNIARYAIAWGAVGAAEACFEEAFTHIKKRQSFGKPIASFQLVQKSLADMATHLSNAQLFAYNLARLADTGMLTHLQISMAKRSNISSALEVARTARDLLGANGMRDQCVAFRHMANLTALSTTDGTDNIHALIIGQALTGYSAYV